MASTHALVLCAILTFCFLGNVLSRHPHYTTTAISAGRQLRQATSTNTNPTSCGSTLASGNTSVPLAKPGGECGAGVGMCPDNECCDQYGKCRAGACESTCQCEFSGMRSNCPGSTELSNLGIPTAQPGAICGPGVAVCPTGEFCSQFGFCSSQAALVAGCSPGASGSNSACTAPANSVVRRYNLTLKWQDSAPDGFVRPTVTINGIHPGPVLHCNVGDRMVVKMDNQLREPATIHWHGLLQRGTVSQDGTAGVTQRAIAPGTSQLYNFICILPGDYWYHSHFKGQYMDGLRGALIINDPSMPAPAAQGVLQLTDWYHQTSDDLLKVYIKSDNTEGVEPVPYSALMNGVGQDPSRCSPANCTYPVLPAATGTCDERKTQISIINEAGFGVFSVSIDDHFMVVTAIDGVFIEPSAPLKAVRINVGQRMRVAVCHDTFPLNATAPAWIRASMQQSVFATNASVDTVLGVLQYGEVTEKPRELPKTDPDIISPDQVLNENAPGSQDPYDFRPISGATPPPATTTVTLNISFVQDPNTDSQFPYPHFNGISLKLPADGGPANASLLEQLLDNNPLPANKDFGYNTITVPEGAVVDVIINNFDGGEHPLHLHGHWFWVMQRGDNATGVFDPAKYPLDPTPLLRDTATVNGGSFLVLRYVANNPGAWIFHCHIDWHLEAGLALVWRYGIGADQPSL